MIKLTSTTVHTFPEISQTPFSNTGSECQNRHLEASVDYFQGTSHFSTLERLKEAVSFAFENCNDNVVFEHGKPCFAGITFEHSASSIRGGKVGYRLTDAGVYHCWLSIPGGCWHQIDGLSQWRNLVGLHHAFGFKSTRIDFKIRDYSRRKLPSEIIEQAQLGNVARVKTYEFSGSGKIGEAPTQTAYLGSRSSEKFLRVYDSLPVHNENAIDWEVQLRDGKAQAAFLEFVTIPSSEDTAPLIAQFIGGVVVGSVEFIDRQENTRLSRQPVQEWWQGFVDEVGSRIRISVAKPTQSLQKTFDWIDRSVSVKLSALRSGLGRTNFYLYLTNLLNKSERRFTRVHEAIISLCSEENSYSPLTQTSILNADI